MLLAEEEALAATFSAVLTDTLYHLSYRVLNRTGLAKALKKFEKATHIPCANAFATKIDNSNFVKSEQLDQLIRDTEDAFTRVFEHGDRKKASVTESSLALPS